MGLRYFHVDAFTGELFAGNPAGVCLLEQELPDALLQRIAAEHNLSETAFIYPSVGATRRLRWFTPTVEMDLCGHATLASAHVLWHHAGEPRQPVKFTTASGLLTVLPGDNGQIVLNFPARAATPASAPDDAALALSATPLTCAKARDWLFTFPNEATVRDLRPDFARLAAWEGFGVIVTAPGDNVDFVSRFFAPLAGVPEDPVTGSAHCTLIPYWAERLGKSSLQARQVSARGGELFCEMAGDRVKIGGHAVTYLQGELSLP
jgi:PhzF family phenazine biosynthesis protein